jgi:predicted nucleotidyltransferase component of viral defense system
MGKPKEEDGIRFSDLNKIAAMKLDAITKRTRARDFIDIAYLSAHTFFRSLCETNFVELRTM